MAAAKAKINPTDFMTQLERSTDDLPTNDAAVASLRRIDLVLLAKHLDIQHTSGIRKAPLYELVLLELNEKGLVSEQAVESLDQDPLEKTLSVPVTAPAESVEAIEARAKARREELDLQKQANVAKLELEAKAREKELELQVKLEAEKNKALELQSKARREEIMADAEAKEKLLLAEAEARSKTSEAKVREAQAKVIEQTNQLPAPEPRATSYVPAFDATRHSKMVPQFQDKDIDAYFVTFEYTASTLLWPKESC